MRTESKNTTLPVSDEEARRLLIAGRRAHGSHSATLADQLVRREKLLKEVADATEKANMAYRKAIEYERVDRTLVKEVAPGRRNGVTMTLPPLDEHPPRDATLFAKLADVTAQETAARAARQTQEVDVMRRSGLTKLAVTGGVPVSTI